MTADSDAASRGRGKGLGISKQAITSEHAHILSQLTMLPCETRRERTLSRISLKLLSDFGSFDSISLCCRKRGVDGPALSGAARVHSA